MIQYHGLNKCKKPLNYIFRCEELILFFGGSHVRYPLSHSVLVAKYLTVLTLHSCKLDSIRSDINLPSLKRLSLLGIYANNQIIQNLIFGCPMIEDMRISCCRGIKCLKIFGLPKVMKILVQNNHLDRLELEASNLRDLCIIEGWLSELNLLPLKNLKMLMPSKNHCSQIDNEIGRAHV